MTVPSGDRRTELRRPLLLECDWTREARVTDLSARGCYVDAFRVPHVGEVVDFSIVLDGTRVRLHGRVMHAKEAVGFAVEFTALSDDAGARVHAWLASPARRQEIQAKG